MKLSMRYGKWLIALFVVVCIFYALGFYAVALGFRSENDNVRWYSVVIDSTLYSLIIHWTREGSIARQLTVHRSRWLCAGYELRCGVKEE